MKSIVPQAEFFGVMPQPGPPAVRLRVNDVLRIGGKLCRVIRVTDFSAVVLMSRPRREFKTRFDKPVSFQPAPALFHISPNSEVEIVNRKPKAASPRRHG